MKGSRRSTLAQSKDTEREFAKRAGGRRLRAGEWKGPGDVDAHGGWWIAQVKHRAFPGFLREALAQIEEAAVYPLSLRPLGIVAWKDKPGRGGKARWLVIQTLEDWVDWQGRGDE